MVNNRKLVYLTMKLCYALSLLSCVSGQQRGSPRSETERRALNSNKMNNMGNSMGGGNNNNNNNVSRPRPIPIVLSTNPPTMQPIVDDRSAGGGDEYYEQERSFQYIPKGRTASPFWYDGLISDLLPPRPAGNSQPVITPSLYFAPSQAPSEDSTTLGFPTPRPVNPTPQPVEPTPQPVNPTPQPVNPTPQPVNPTPQPVNPTPQPVNPTPQPVNPTPQPVIPTPQPVEPTSVPRSDDNNPTNGSGGSPVVTRTPAPAASSSGPIPPLLYTDIATDPNAWVLNNENGDREDVGTRLIYDVELKKESDGSLYGKLYGVCTRISETVKLYSCQLTYDFAAGTSSLSALGTLKYFGYGSVLNIVGGSGEFVGAKGTVGQTYTLTDDPGEDDVFRVTFDLEEN